MRMETSLRSKKEWRSVVAAPPPRNRSAMARIPRLVFKPRRGRCLNQRSNALTVAYSIVKQTVGFAFALGALVALNGSPRAIAQPLTITMKAIIAHEYGGPDA